MYEYIYIYIYMCVYVCVYIYIYIYREREREREICAIICKYVMLYIICTRASRRSGPRKTTSRGRHNIIVNITIYRLTGHHIMSLPLPTQDVAPNIMLTETVSADLRAQAALVCWCKRTACATTSMQLFS